MSIDFKKFVQGIKSPKHKRAWLMVRIFAPCAVVLAFAAGFKLLRGEPMPMFVPEPEIIAPEIATYSPDQPSFWSYGPTMYRYAKATRKYYFVVDRDKGIVREVKIADPRYFSVVMSFDGAAFSFAASAGLMYCNDRPMYEADKQTFELIDQPTPYYGLYAKDRNAVYYNCKTLRGADPATFELLLDSHQDRFSYAKDAEHVYTNGVVLEGADPKTYKVLGDGLAMDSKYVYRGLEKIGTRDFRIDKGSTGRILRVSNLTDQKSDVAVFVGENGGGVLESMRIAPFWDQNQLVVSGGKIYFSNPEGAPWVFDSADNSTKKLELKGFEPNEGEDVAMMDIFIAGKTAYLLYSRNCYSGRLSCGWLLLEHDLDTARTRTVASDIRATDILGIDEANGLLYARFSYGDAGCFNVSLYSVDLASGHVNKDSHSGCEGDGKSYETELAAIDFLSYDERIHTDAVYIKNGAIVPPPKTQDFDGKVDYIFD